MMVSHKKVKTGSFAAIILSVLDFQKKMLGPADLYKVFIFGHQNKNSSHQKLYLRTNGIQ